MTTVEEMSPEPQTPQPPPGGRQRRVLRKLKEWTLAILAFIVLASVGSTVIGQLRAPNLPDVAPEFALRNLEGQIVKLSDVRGRTVVLNFWATWCPPCRVELPSFVKFANLHPDVVVLGLATQSPPADLRAAIDKFEIPYQVLIVDKAVADAYAVKSLPSTIVVDADGSVRHSHGGMLFGPQLRFMTR